MGHYNKILFHFSEFLYPTIQLLEVVNHKTIFHYHRLTLKIEALFDIYWVFSPFQCLPESHTKTLERDRLRRNTSVRLEDQYYKE